MKLSLKNIGKLNDSQIEINGLTIIAGDNNTGKSTVNKALYAAFKSLNNYKEKIYYNRLNKLKKSILGIVRRSLRRGSLRRESIRSNYSMRSFLTFRNNINSLLENFMSDEVQDSNKLVDEIFEFFNSDNLEIEKKQIVEIIEEILNVSDYDIFKNLSSGNFEAEFNGQISNLYESNKKSLIQLEISKTKTSFEFYDNSISEINEPIDLEVFPIYIDGQSRFEDESESLLLGINHNNHNIDFNKMLNNKKYNVDEIDWVLNNKKLNKLIGNIKRVVPGEMIQDESDGYFYIENNKRININNVSSGLKSFIYIKELILKGFIKKMDY
ncbi:ATP-binding protein [Fructilactobacillus cliffordii]|uniref:AAA family ATPase n=1 Tax=Fructilactobacillus cliffordii TaxID=2940299 RepID=UPI0020936244|nr:AAA family ATPase [Fructilactobacillus cliffordii]USS86947.1 ATP-binding protein [Fructilactobacillus cliffordii]